MSSQLPQDFHALVVGGTSGIGLGIAKQLSAQPSAHITIASRNGKIGLDISNSAPNKNIEFRRVDASLMRNIRTFCEAYAASLQAGEQVDVLVLSQGQMVFKANKTEEGLGLAVALIYYGRILFVRELIRLGILSPTAVVVFILNSLQGDPLGSKVQWDNIDLSNGKTSLFKVLAHNMSLLDIMVQTLAKADTEKRIFIHDHPGTVNTDILEKSDLPGIIKRISRLTPYFMKLMSTDKVGESVVAGTLESREALIKGGKRWIYLKEHGKSFNKPESPDDVRNRVRDHTYRLLDEALRGKVRTHN